MIQLIVKIFTTNLIVIHTILLINTYSSTQKGKVIVYPEGEHLISNLEINSDTTLKGIGKVVFKIKKNNPGIIIRDSNTVTIKNIDFISENSPAIHIIGEKSCTTGIRIHDCNFFFSTSYSDTIIINGNVSRIKIANNNFFGLKTFNRPIKTDYNQVSFLRLISKKASIANKKKCYDSKENISILNNYFDGHECAIRFQGKKVPAFNNLLIKGNFFTDQKVHSLFLYHSKNSNVSKNTFYDIKTLPAKNYDGAAIFLDQYHGGYTIFKKNSIKKIVGNAIYAEELKQADFSYNTISEIETRDAQKKYQFGYNTGNIKKFLSITSNGGNGIIIGGGVHNISLSKNTIKNCNGHGILLSTTISIPKKNPIKNIHLKNNNLINCFKSIGIEGKVFQISTSNNYFSSYSIDKLTFIHFYNLYKPTKTNHRKNSFHITQPN